MAYCTVADVEKDFKEIAFTATTLVSVDDVNGFITEADALINAYVGTVYTVPVSAGDGLNLLRLLSRSLVTGRIKKMSEVKQVRSESANQNVTSTLLSAKDVMAILKQIQDKTLKLAGATGLDSSNGFYSNNVANEVEAVVQKDEKQW